MKRILIIGCPGSGKSTLSGELHRATGTPLYHLDMMYWNPDKTTVGKELFKERLSQVLAKERWIIDGNYQSTMEQRMAACDTVIFLDYPKELCLQGVKARAGKPRSDLPWIEEEIDEEFLDFICDFGQEIRPKILALLQKYADKKIYILKNRGEAEKFKDLSIKKGKRAKKQ